MSFRDVQGHRRLVDLLSRSIARGTLPPSLIFAGADTRDVALAVAQALNCQSPVTGHQSSVGPTTDEWRPATDACRTCAACTRIARGVHPDVLVIQPGDSGSIKIEQVRDAIDRAGYRPFEGRRRVVIVDGADALVAAAQNALLKTLEEPPASSVFILLTARPDLLLATVRSRCIRLTFADAADAEVDVDARALAGSVLLKAAAGKDPVRRIETAKELHPKMNDSGAAAREHVAKHLRAMASLLRDAEIVAARADAPIANGDAADAVERLASVYGGDRGVQAYGAIDRALAALDRNGGAKIVADWVVLHL